MTALPHDSMIDLPADYRDRVYAGVLGKLIGVYLGRPFEQWSHEHIMRELGPITSYQHEKLGKRLIVTDDDISGTFTFVRAMADHHAGCDVTAKQIGQTWLNYIAEGRHILWWGGMGLSTEHTAYLRLKRGIDAPRSGSIELNGAAVAQEIGAQIFIDSWAMIAPGQPDRAAYLADQAARVSHDGVAVHAAVLLAVMESLAFIESDIDHLLDAGLRYIPADSELASMVTQIRTWCRQDADWQTTLKRVQENFGYERYATNCPVMSNHALIILALLHGRGDFDRSMMIVNTSGWDTDCNSGNVGCLLGIRNGLGCFQQAYDWRTPVNDRAFIAAADGHRGVTDAAAITLELVNMGLAMAGHEPLAPKGEAVFHFSLPGSTQGFAPDSDSQVTVLAHAVDDDCGGLHIQLLQNAGGAIETAVFLPPESIGESSYAHAATPRLYAGQSLVATLRAAAVNIEPIEVALRVRAYGPGGQMQQAASPAVQLKPGEERSLQWNVPAMGNWPIHAAGLTVRGRANDHCVLDRMHWSGEPALDFAPPANRTGTWATAWERAWVGSMHQFHHRGAFQATGPFDLTHNQGRGILHTGSADWRNYAVHAEVTPWLADECGVAIRVRGLTRYYGVIMRKDELALICMNHEETTLAKAAWSWQRGQTYQLELECHDDQIRGKVIGGPTLVAQDTTLSFGGLGLLLAEGRAVFQSVKTAAIRSISSGPSR